MKEVALVHDWLIHMRGGEKVLEALAEIYPDATIYTLFSDRTQLSPPLQRMKIKNSFLQRLPGIRKYYRWLLPFFPWIIRTLRIPDADWVISSSHCAAKAVTLPGGSRHVCYCHTPMRYLWGFEEEYFGGFPEWVRSAMEPVFERLREWDVESSKNVEFFLCNSKTVQERIRQVYSRESLVIHPPADTQFFHSLKVPKDDFYLVVSALTPYKRIDLAVDAFNQWDRRLIIAGEGPEKNALQKRVQTKNIEFLGKVTNERLRQLYSQARALIFPQVEDFGIVPVEAQACGTPVIAFAKGGALESVKDGIFFHEQTPEALRKAVRELEKKNINRENLRKHAVEFDKEIFKTKIGQALQHVLV